MKLDELGLGIKGVGLGSTDCLGSVSDGGRSRLGVFHGSEFGVHVSLTLQARTCDALGLEIRILVASKARAY